MSRDFLSRAIISSVSLIRFSVSEIARRQPFKADLDMSNFVLDFDLNIAIIFTMTTGINNYKTSLDKALEELAGLAEQREGLIDQVTRIDERAEKLRQGIFGLAVLADENFEALQDKYPDLLDSVEPSRMGLTESVREALKRADNEFLSPPQIRDRVVDLNPAIAKHRSPMASVHAVLRRLGESGEILGVTWNDGRTAYAWAGTDEAFEKAVERLAPDKREAMLKRWRAKRARKTGKESNRD
jgi:hypothetical protein